MSAELRVAVNEKVIAEAEAVNVYVAVMGRARRWRPFDPCPRCRRRRIRVYPGRWFGRVVQCDSCRWRAAGPYGGAREMTVVGMARRGP